MMTTKQKKENTKSLIREQLLQSAIASFRIEGIKISTEQAIGTLMKVEAKPGKWN